MCVCKCLGYDQIDDWYHSNYPKEWFILSQIRGRVVVLKDRIHKELGNQLDLIVIWLS